MRPNAAQPLTRRSRYPIGFACVFAMLAIVFLFPFSDPFFKTTELHGGNTELVGSHGRTVVQFGTSILSRKEFADGADQYRDRFTGPCFVDSTGPNGMKREYGMQLVIVGSPHGSKTIEIR